MQEHRLMWTEFSAPEELGHINVREDSIRNKQVKRGIINWQYINSLVDRFDKKDKGVE